MLRTKSFISDITEVPREWVFEYYLTLPETLTGQDVKITSPFNPGEKNPSFFVYYSKSALQYKYKDFSTDAQGDGVSLVKMLFNIPTRGSAAHKIIDDYNEFVLNNPDSYKLREFKIRQKYKVTAFTPRNWNKQDEKFWMQFRINSKLLEHYNVRPLKNYTLTKELDNGKKKELLMNSSLMYGYFKRDGVLYKVYQPYIKKTKFLKVVANLQGVDQLTFKKPYLVICSSLKDIMAFNKLGFKNAEAIAPDSENTMIPERVINNYKNAYEKVCTLFDNDQAGINSMKKYKEKFGIPGVHLELEKDLSDSIKEHGIKNTRIHLYPLITKALTGKSKQL
jgi:hypothetical protein